MKTSIMVWSASFAVKLLLLTVFVFSKGQAFFDRYDPYKQAQSYDDREYVQTAKRLVEYKTFTVHFGENTSYRSVFRMPGYPVFLALIGILSSWNLFVMLVLQAAFFSLLPVLLWLILKQLKLPKWVVWLCVVDPLLNIISVTFMTEGLFCLVLLAAFYCFLKGEHIGFRFSAYFLLALAILVKPTVQYFYIILVAAGLMMFSKRWLTVVLVAVSLAPVGGWLVRNHDVTGKWILSTQSDNMVLAIPIMEEFRTGISGADVVKQIVREHRDDYEPVFSEQYWNSLSGLLRDNKFDFKEETEKYILAHPVLFVRCHIQGMIRVLFGTMKEHVGEVFFLGGTVPAAFLWIYNAVVGGYYLLLYAAILTGFRWRFLRQPSWLLSILFVAYNVGLIGVFAYMTGGGLKRLPFIPFVYILLAFSMETWCEWCRRWRQIGVGNGDA